MVQTFTMRLILLSSLLIIHSAIFGQTLISSAGSVNSQFSYSLGELFIVTASDSSKMVSAGFHQPNLWGVAVMEHPEIKARIFPNPTNSQITLEVYGVQAGRKFVLTSPDGRVLLILPLNQERTVIPFDNYAAGTYNLTITELDKIIANYRIIKVK
jgi:hypothetical protein